MALGLVALHGAGTFLSEPTCIHLSPQWLQVGCQCLHGVRAQLDNLCIHQGCSEVQEKWWWLQTGVFQREKVNREIWKEKKTQLGILLSYCSSDIYRGLIGNMESH